MLWWVVQGIHQALVCAGHNVASQCSLEIFKFLDSVPLSTLTAWIKSMKTEKRLFFFAVPQWAILYTTWALLVCLLLK